MVKICKHMISPTSDDYMYSVLGPVISRVEAYEMSNKDMFK